MVKSYKDLYILNGFALPKSQTYSLTHVILMFLQFQWYIAQTNIFCSNYTSLIDYPLDWSKDQKDQILVHTLN